MSGEFYLGYTSTALTETLEDDDEIIGGHFGPHFVYGDVTHPKMKSVDNSETVIIAHVADNSGLYRMFFHVNNISYSICKSDAYITFLNIIRKRVIEILWTCFIEGLHIQKFPKF